MSLTYLGTYTQAPTGAIVGDGRVVTGMVDLGAGVIASLVLVGVSGVRQMHATVFNAADPTKVLATTQLSFGSLWSDAPTSMRAGHALRLGTGRALLLAFDEAGAHLQACVLQWNGASLSSGPWAAISQGPITASGVTYPPSPCPVAVATSPSTFTLVIPAAAGGPSGGAFLFASFTIGAGDAITPGTSFTAFGIEGSFTSSAASAARIGSVTYIHAIGGVLKVDATDVGNPTWLPTGDDPGLSSPVTINPARSVRYIVARANTPPQEILS